ncbi:MAG: hypothetical protein KF814_02180 [Nitrospiraceae bacterium]|nr:hypothetical protein [Nitrospiraceae bacterium]
MGRKYEVVDVLAAVGLAATLFGGYLLVTAADGFWQRPPVPVSVSATAADLSVGIQYLQPVLGQAIVDGFIRDRDAAATVSAASEELDLAIEDYQRISTTLLSPLALAELTAMGQAADHQVRVQYVMGRNLVNETRRGVRSGLLSPMYYGSAFNAEVIRRTEALGRRMDEQFEAGRQPMLGRMIVESAQEETRLDAAAQERIALAVIRQAAAEAAYEEATAADQAQLASATVAAIRSNALQERLDRLAMFDAEAIEGRPAVAHTRITPDIHYGYLMAACLGLIALFVGALSLVRRRAEDDAMPMWKVETLLRLHRSTT